MAFRTLNALLPGYTVHLVPYSAAPCGCLQPGGLLAGPRGAQAYMCSAAAGDTLSPDGEKSPLLTSLRSLLKCSLTHPKTLPSFSSLLIPSLCFSLQRTYFLTHMHTHMFLVSLTKQKVHLGRDPVFCLSHCSPVPITHKYSLDSNQHTVWVKLTQCSMSIVFQLKKCWLTKLIFSPKANIQIATTIFIKL